MAVRAPKLSASSTGANPPTTTSSSPPSSGSPVRCTRHPTLSDRSDIIVITDEAHRSQYDTFAQNMRKALPNASFIGFTGTPLLKQGEEKTRETFGDYVSVYNFGQSVKDGSTVPLYYENRVAKLENVNPQLEEELGKIMDYYEMNDEEEEKVE